MPKPRTQDGYTAEDLNRSKSGCLQLAITLGSFKDDYRIVGGLVPSLIIDQNSETFILDPHVGTKDVDVGLSLKIYDDDRYIEFEAALRGSGFQPGTNESGKPTFQTWRLNKQASINVTVDFLIEPTERTPPAGRLAHLTKDLSTIVSPGVPMAFADYIDVNIDHVTLDGHLASRNVLVCGPAAFILMKSLAVGNGGRDEPKDAYDLAYVLRHWPEADLAARLRGIPDTPVKRMAVANLTSDFATVDRIGPRRALEFLGQDDDYNSMADIVSRVKLLLAKL